ncbi:MAG: isoprenylcysteine carboxylmethyltransferase family protein [Candidatus Aminicenantes bacterium]|nr:isoprenylcysteine carboxylmethyltransferase family protein [Candidatus Aminicenantes bacterium]
MNGDKHSRSRLIKIVSLRLLGAILLLPAIFFLPAGTFAYWEAWLYSAILFFAMFLVLLYLLKNDPELLERRMKTREKEAEQKLIIKISSLYFLLAFLLPGFDKRFGWSHVPVVLVIAADVLVLLGYGMFFLVLRENSYASRIIQVESEQRVISSGPYSLVRHPMYLGIMLMYSLSPLALGSYWALIPSLLILPILVARILNEERVLGRELEGYQEYVKKTKYRLIPGIW